MKLVILSSSFYDKYKDKHEILHKDSRPYVCLTLRVEDQTFAIPLRHHINHPFAFRTVGEAGLDYTKTVLIESEAYISADTPRIDTVEWNIIKRNEEKILYEFRKYLRKYKRAQAHPDNPRSDYIVKYSSLQYFEL